MIIRLKENKSKRVQIAKTGTFEHDVYGKFSITLADLKDWKANFEANVRRMKLEDGKPALPLDYKHAEEDIAAGWIRSLDIGKDKNGVDAIFAEVEWTPRGAQKVRDKEFAFISPSYRPVYKDKETGQYFKNVLKGATLTNIPFVRDMNVVHLLSESKRAAFESLKQSGDNPDINLNQGENMPKWKKILEGLDSVSPEDKKKLSEAIEEDSKKLSEKAKEDAKKLKKAQGDLKLSEKEIKDLQEEAAKSEKTEDSRIKLAEQEVKDLKEKVGSLTKKLAEDAKKSEFDKMLLSGKVCEAQRKPFMENDLVEFAKNAQDVKLDEAGANSKGDESMEQAEEQLIQLADKKAREEKMEFGAAMSIVLSEKKNAALKKAAGY
jgi:phage I-like protein